MQIVALFAHFKTAFSPFLAPFSPSETFLHLLLMERLHAIARSTWSRDDYLMKKKLFPFFPPYYKVQAKYFIFFNSAAEVLSISRNQNWSYLSHPPRVTCHMSHVRYQVSLVTCFLSFFRQICWANWWRVCYQQGLPF